MAHLVLDCIWRRRYPFLRLELQRQPYPIRPQTAWDVFGRVAVIFGVAVQHVTFRTLKRPFLRLRSLGLLRAVFRATGDPVSDTTLSAISRHLLPNYESATHQIQSPSHKMILHPRTILRTSSSHHDHRMLLHIMPYHHQLASLTKSSTRPIRPTLSRYIRSNNLPTAKPHPRNFPLS